VVRETVSSAEQEATASGFSARRYSEELGRRAILDYGSCRTETMMGYRSNAIGGGHRADEWAGVDARLKSAQESDGLKPLSLFTPGTYAIRRILA
jgi:hypothetical protein